MTTETEELNFDIDLDLTKWRIQTTNGDKTKGLYIAYWDARVVAEKLDELFGVHGWSDSYEISRGSNKQDSYVICTLTVIRDGVAISKQGVGILSDVESWKGGESDAFKRAAAKWGVGRNVYRIEPIWAEIRLVNGKAYPAKGIFSFLRNKAKAQIEKSEWAGSFDNDDAKGVDEPEDRWPNDEVTEDQWGALVEAAKRLDADGKGIVREWAKQNLGWDKPNKATITADEYTQYFKRVMEENNVLMSPDEVAAAFGGEAAE